MVILDGNIGTLMISTKKWAKQRLRTRIKIKN